MDRIVTHQLPLAQFQQGIDLVEAGNRSIKVTLTP
jgi:threonine dehydrogenase-like Zn-dependent dehydrogenase